VDQTGKQEPLDAVSISFELNGQVVSTQVPARALLADVLRDRFGLTGTHLGCEQGVCGACTVLLDGQAVRSCLIFGAQVDGCGVTTVEGLTVDGELTALQQAFWNQHALQCAFCTSGLLMSGTELLASEASPSDEQVIDCVSGHVCRCTGYEGLVKAFKQAVAAPSEPSDD